MTWFRRGSKPTLRPPAAPMPVPSWSADPSWWSDPVVRLTFADGSIVELRADDPRTCAFVALADLLVGQAGHPPGRSEPT